MAGGGLIGKLRVWIGVNNSDYKKGLDQSKQQTSTFAKEVKGNLKSIGTALGITFGIGALVQFGKKIIQTRGEFQSLEISLTSLLRSKQAANELMREMVDLAARTPFSLQDVATGGKQLIAYGFSAKEVTGTLSQLGNVAAALGLPMERLTYLYGTTRTQGRLFARDLMQFTTSGIPLLDELAKMFGKSTEEVNKMVSAGSIGFEEVKQAFGNMTGEGGKFYNLMEERSKGISGKISNLGDAISVMFNKIGQSQEGGINSALDGAKFLVDNYKSVLDILKALIATYGVYKATSIVSNSIQKISDRVTYEAEISALQKLIPIKQASKNADIEEAVAKGRLSEASAKQIVAIRAQIAAKLEDLRVTAQKLAAEQATAVAEYKSSLQRNIAARQNMALAQSQMRIAILGGNAVEIAAAKKAAQTAKIEVNSAAIAKNTTQQALNTARSKASAAATAVDTMQTNVNTVATNTGSAAKNLMTAATMRLTKVFHSLKLAFVSNPFGMILTGITLAISAFSIFSKETNNATDSCSAFSLQMQQEKSTLNDLKKALSETAYGSKERADIINLINQRYKDYLPSLLTEKDSIDKITSALTKANEKLTENLRLKLKASRLEEIQSTQLGVETNFVSSFTDAYKSQGNKTPEQIALFANSLAQLTEKAREGGASVDDARKVLIALGHDAERVNGAIISSDNEISKELRNVVSWFNSIESAASEAGTQTAVLNALVADLGDKTVDKEKEVAETYRTRAEILADIKARITEISALEAKPKKTSSEIKNLETLRGELKTYEDEYKTFTGKEFGAKVKKSAELLAQEEAANTKELAFLKSQEQSYGTTLVFQEKLLAVMREHEGFVRSDDERIALKAQNDELERQIKLRKEMGGGLLTIESLQNRIADAEARRKKSGVGSEEFKSLTAEIERLKSLLDYIEKPRVINISVIADDLGKIMDSAMKPIDEAVDRHVADYAKKLADMKAVIQEFEDIIEGGVESTIIGLAEALGQLAAGNDGAAWQAFLNPIADMAVQLGSMGVAIGIGIDGIKKSFFGLTGAPAIAAGLALIALGTAAKIAISSIPNKAAGGSSQSDNTFTGGYSNGGSSTRTAQSLQLASPQPQVVVLETRVSGSDIVFVVAKENIRRKG